MPKTITGSYYIYSFNQFIMGEGQTCLVLDQCNVRTRKMQRMLAFSWHYNCEPIEFQRNHCVQGKRNIGKDIYQHVFVQFWKLGKLRKYLCWLTLWKIWREANVNRMKSRPFQNIKTKFSIRFDVKQFEKPLVRNSIYILVNQKVIGLCFNNITAFSEILGFLGNLINSPKFEKCNYSGPL